MGQDVKDFIRKHEGEWYSPNEIHNETKSDLRTVKNSVSRLTKTSYWTTYEGYRVEIAQREDRIYCVRLVKDIENSVRLIKEEMAEVEGIKENIESVRDVDLGLLEKHSSCYAVRDAIRYHFQHSDLKRLRTDIRDLKESKLEQLREYLQELGGHP